MNFLFGALGWGQLIKSVQTNDYSGTTTVASTPVVMGDVNMGQVVTGDICLCVASAQLVNGPGGAGNMQMAISNATGTATVVYGVAGSSLTWEMVATAGNVGYRLPWMTWGRVTAGGTWIPRFVQTCFQVGSVGSASATLYLIRGS